MSVQNNMDHSSNSAGVWCLNEGSKPILESIGIFTAFLKDKQTNPPAGFPYLKRHKAKKIFCMGLKQECSSQANNFAIFMGPFMKMDDILH